ncbi:Mitochondrial ribonuclease P catalytic subunit [Trichinella spiralis]|uniref:Mitochondrial ribonuclease P catalytic subunit n=1 Tax=Trichinella spiralis TaxID=6334 RepID=A0ABR3KJ28_TRISP
MCKLENCYSSQISKLNDRRIQVWNEASSLGKFVQDENSKNKLLEIVIYLHNNQILHWNWVENFEVEPEAGRTRENVKNRDIFPAVQQIASPA